MEKQTKHKNAVYSEMRNYNRRCKKVAMGEMLSALFLHLAENPPAPDRAEEIAHGIRLLVSSL